jgi:hypothetical protein
LFARHICLTYSLVQAKAKKTEDLLFMMLLWPRAHRPSALLQPSTAELRLNQTRAAARLKETLKGKNRFLVAKCQGKGLPAQNDIKKRAAGITGPGDSSSAGGVHHTVVSPVISPVPEVELVVCRMQRRQIWNGGVILQNGIRNLFEEIYVDYLASLASPKLKKDSSYKRMRVHSEEHDVIGAHPDFWGVHCRTQDH